MEFKGEVGLSLENGDAEFEFYCIRAQLYDPENVNFSQLHSHSFYELHFVTGGTYTYCGEYKSITLSSGEFLVIPPIVPHYSAKTSKDYKSTVIQFSLNRCDGESGFFKYFTESLECASMQPMRASEALLKALERYEVSFKENAIQRVCRLKALTSEIVYLLFDDINGYKSKSIQKEKTDEKKDFLVTLDYMVSSSKYSLTDIAEATGYSTRNISRLINSIYKSSLSELRRKFALESAKKLLISADSNGVSPNMEEVAEEAGFKNAAAMRNAFKKYEKTTPNDFRNDKNM